MFSAEVSSSVGKNGSEGLSAGIESALLEAADAGFEHSQEKVAQHSTDTGGLLRSGIPPERQPDGSVVWGYNAPHAKPVEFGTAPHWAPIDPLKDWARRVLGDESVAYAVQKKIANEGTDPSPFFRPGVNVMKRRLRAQNVESFVEDEL